MENNSTFEIEHMKKQFDEYVISSKIDNDGNITCVSGALCKISGYESDELIGKPFDHLYSEKSISFDEIKEKLKKITRYITEKKSTTKDGTDFWTKIIVTPYTNSCGEIMGYSTIQEDITSKVKLVAINNDLENIVIEKVHNLLSKDQQLLKQSKLAAMGEMMNAIAHQWKQPVHAISMAVSQIEMCKDLGIEITDEILTKITAQVDKQVDDLTKTIDEFRQFFKPNQHRELLNIKESIEKTLLFLDDSIKLNNLDIELNGDEDLEYEFIPQEFKHVFINLIGNAKDAFNDNEIKKRNMLIDILKEDKYIKITVSDNAGGIPSHIIDDIFKVDVTSKKDGKGTGIGLYMTTQIIEKLDGFISVENIENRNGEKGAIFIIKLPIH